MKKLLGKIRRASADYNMIESGDKIAVGLSGGKDSLALLVLLDRLSKFLPEEIKVEAICLDLGLNNFDVGYIKAFCDELNIPLHVKKTEIGKIVFDIKKPKSPCGLCANLRRGALNNTAKELGFNKVALGHHMDDVIETFHLSMYYEGRLSLFSPVTFLDRTQITVIRPMIYIEEYEIRKFVNKNKITPVKNPCVTDGNTKRDYVKVLLNDLYGKNYLFKNNIFSAIRNSGIDGW